MTTPRHSGITKKDALAIVESCKARAAASSRRAQGTHCTEFQYSVLQARFAVKPLPNAREPSALSQAIGMTPKDSKTSRGLPTTFKGIVLNRPTIKFPTDPNPVAFDSKVSTDFKIHEKFFISAKMDNWEVVFMRNEEVRDFTESIIQAMGQYGMAGQPPSHLH
ncbi:hypothetical protein L3Y34_013836 [Caenorhabditis briggsae]|uniref:Uncharacterized protein n=1 Tax=Caenorhabditis briggsae TaxID=6238 RepID=A0AAE9CYC1_CAEBR|nr:hypothetical protein L3Y34_013836 [Caenorhabditis briggsae]